MKTNRLNANDADFVPRLMALTAWSEERDEEVGERVRGILRDVAGRGDAAVVEYTTRFDRRDATSMADLTVERAQLEAALERLPAEQRQALEAAAERVSDYHARQKQDSWHYRDAHGTLLGQQVTPLDRAGIYVPGGKAYFSCGHHESKNVSLAEVISRGYDRGTTLRADMPSADQVAAWARTLLGI